MVATSPGAAADGPTARPRSGTRRRILEVALRLFNEQGADRVTTAEIAQAASINQGNLYYYFQRKEHLVLALFDDFAAATGATACQIPSAADRPEAYAAYQRGWFALMWDYRFFYRDGAALRTMAPALRDRLCGLSQRSQAAVRQVFELMRTHGLMRATDADIDILIGNLWIVSSYWMDYRLANRGHQVTRDDLAWGLTQVEHLTRPYLVL